MLYIYVNGNNTKYSLKNHTLQKKCKYKYKDNKKFFTIAFTYIAIRPLVLSGLSLTFVFHYIQHLTHYTTFISFPLDKVVVPVKCSKEMSDMNLFSIIDLPPVILALVSGNLLITFVLDCLFFCYHLLLFLIIYKSFCNHYFSINLPVYFYLYIYIFIYICICVYIYMYILYIYIHILLYIYIYIGTESK